MRARFGRLLNIVARKRLGLEIGSTIVRGVLIARGEIIETSSMRLEDPDALSAAVIAVLDSTSGTLWRRPHVSVAVGASMSQVRRLGSLPAVDDDRALRALISNCSGRFFLRNGVTLLTSRATQDGYDEKWGAALDEPPVRTVAEACRSRRLRLELATPAVVALQYALRDTTLIAHDGDVVVEAHVSAEGEWSQVRRIARIDANPAIVATPVDQLRTLGENALEYAVAYGAATLDGREPLAIHARQLRNWDDRRVPKWRLTLAAAALVISTGLALILPGVLARRVIARSTAELAIINRQYREARWTEAELERTNGSLSEIDAFQHNRRQAFAFLSEMSEAMPESVWLQSLQIDPQGGMLTALAPRAADAIAALANVKSILSVAIVGSVSNEQLGVDRVERVTIRFRWKSTGNGAVTATSTGGAANGPHDLATR